MNMKSLIVVCALFLAVIGGMGCQNDLSDEDIDRIVTRMAEDRDEEIDRIFTRMAEDREENASAMVDALMASPKYLSYLQDDKWVEEFTNAMMAHPASQTTPREDCATIILMAAVMSGDYTLPPESDADRLCAWYINQK